MPSVTSNQVPALYRDDNFEAYATQIAQENVELEQQGFFDLFGERELESYSAYKTHLYSSYTQESARNPGEPLAPGTNAQGYNYYTAMRVEWGEMRSIHAEYLSSVLKLKDYAKEQGQVQAMNHMQAWATYWTQLFSYGAIATATLAATGNGTPGQHPRSRIFAHWLKGEPGSILAELPKTDAADPDGLPWFSPVGTPHIRANGDTSASYAGRTLGFFNMGSSVSGGNMFLTEQNLSAVLLHMENDLPWLADRKLYLAPPADTLVVSGNLKAAGKEIIDVNEYRMNSSTNDKNILFKQAKVYELKNVIVNRYLPDNCWYVGAKGRGLHKVFPKNIPGIVGFEGPARGTYSNIYVDMSTQTWIAQFYAYWTHWFDEFMDICWYAGSTPITLDSTNQPSAPATSSLVNWAQ